MIKINTHNITWNPNEIKKITEFNLSNRAGNLLLTNARQLHQEAKPKLPKNMGVRKTTKPRLVEAMKVFPPEIKTKKRKGQAVKTQQVQVKPAKRQKYYFVVMSGKNTYNGVKKNLKYSSPTAESFPLEKLMRKKYKNKIQKEFINEYKLLIRELRSKN